jgi:hypothetical protein
MANENREIRTLFLRILATMKPEEQMQILGKKTAWGTLPFDLPFGMFIISRECADEIALQFWDILESLGEEQLLKLNDRDGWDIIWSFLLFGPDSVRKKIATKFELDTLEGIRRLLQHKPRNFTPATANTNVDPKAVNQHMEKHIDELNQFLQQFSSQIIGELSTVF